jgi:hypothetical protein
MEQLFDFKTKYKIIFIILIVAGIAAVIAGLFLSDHHASSRLWANVLLNTVYFISISLCGVVFIVIHILGDSGWQVSIQRVPEAMSMFLPVGSIFMLIILGGLIFNYHHLYHWVHPDPDDKILQMKSAYLNIPFFSIRTIIYLGGWIIFARLLRKASTDEDRDANVKYFNRSNILAGLFIVFFAITSSMSAWDWLMSLDPHWFSTLFGWYVFSGLLAGGTAVILLITIFLKSAGYLPHVNKEHLHDLGKYLFGFSVFWAYLWFSQYMLIWYGNLPEETIYFIERLKNYNTFFLLNVFINFFFPFLALMTRNSKRIPIILAFVAFVAFIGHWLDFYLLVMPGTLDENPGIGIPEIGMTAIFAGIFLFVVFRSLTKANLVPKNHPYLKESLDYHTQY